MITAKELKETYFETMDSLLARAEMLIIETAKRGEYGAIVQHVREGDVDGFIGYMKDRGYGACRSCRDSVFVSWL